MNRELVTLVEGKIRRQFEEIEKKGKTEITQLLESRQVLQKGSEAIQEGE